MNSKDPEIDLPPSSEKPQLESSPIDPDARRTFIKRSGSALIALTLVDLVQPFSAAYAVPPDGNCTASDPDGTCGLVTDEIGNLIKAPSIWG